MCAVHVRARIIWFAIYMKLREEKWTRAAMSEENENEITRFYVRLVFEMNNLILGSISFAVLLSRSIHLFLHQLWSVIGC